ncbi:MAG TPA: hypothetical protein VGP72_31470 [Planctomycetota bacterium]|jgi:hypothetical protein
MNWREFFQQDRNVRSLRDGFIERVRRLINVELTAEDVWADEEPLDATGLLLLSLYREIVGCQQPQAAASAKWLRVCDGVKNGERIVNFKAGRQLCSVPLNFVRAFCAGKPIDGFFETDPMTGESLLLNANRVLLRLPAGLLDHLIELRRTHPEGDAEQTAAKGTS